MNAHPKVKVPPEHEELGFFDRRFNYGIDWYLERLPDVADDEIVFEKTPKYFVYPPALDRIAKTVPNVKLGCQYFTIVLATLASIIFLDINTVLTTPFRQFIILLCNPIDRAFSDYSEGLKYYWSEKSYIVRIKRGKNFF